MIVVTGAAGFIGSNLVRGLNQGGESDVIAVDDLTDGTKHRNLNSLAISDYLDKDELLETLPKFDALSAIFHLGACASTTERNGRFMMRSNFTYSKRLAEFALSQGVPLIYASSAAVYGSGKRGFTEERSCENPLNVYGYSKLAFDNWVRLRLGSAQSPIVGLRYFNVYGPQENHKGNMQSIARQMFLQHQDGGPLRLFEGSDEFSRDFVAVADCVAANLHFYEHGGTGIYNVGTGEARSFTDLARACVETLGECEIATIPFPTELRSQYQAFTRADLTRLRSVGFDHSFVGLEDGLRGYFDVLKRSGGYYLPGAS